MSITDEDRKLIIALAAERPIEEARLARLKQAVSWQHKRIQGLGISAIARRFDTSRETVRAILQEAGING